MTQGSRSTIIKQDVLGVYVYSRNCNNWVIVHAVSSDEQVYTTNKPSRKKYNISTSLAPRYACVWIKHNLTSMLFWTFWSSSSMRDRRSCILSRKFSTIFSRTWSRWCRRFCIKVQRIYVYNVSGSVSAVCTVVETKIPSLVRQLCMIVSDRHAFQSRT